MKIPVQESVKTIGYSNISAPQAPEVSVVRVPVRNSVRPHVDHGEETPLPLPPGIGRGGGRGVKLIGSRGRGLGSRSRGEGGRGAKWQKFS